MGTRNLIMVINEQGEKKVAQYGQWDGYPSGVGVGVLEFLREKKLVEKFKAKLSKVRFIDYDGVDKQFVANYQSNAPLYSNDPDHRTEEQKKWFKTFYSRDLSEEVLTNIANSTDEEILLNDAEESGGIEYSYMINFKTNTFEVYHQIHETPLKVYNLDELPDNDDFISEIARIEENEE